MAASRAISYVRIPLGAAAAGLPAESVVLVDIYRMGAFVLAGLAIALRFSPLGRQPFPDGLLSATGSVELYGGAACGP